MWTGVVQVSVRSSIDLLSLSLYLSSHLATSLLGGTPPLQVLPLPTPLGLKLRVLYSLLAWLGHWGL